MTDELEYMEAHPPRCLGGNCLPANDELRHEIRKYFGESSTAFSPKCICGATVFTVEWSDYPELLDVVCIKCDSARHLFDAKEHGYDGELGHNEGAEASDTSPFICNACKQSAFQVALGFQYAGETDILEEEAAPKVNPEDLFGCLVVVSKCTACGAVQQVGEAECA